MLSEILPASGHEKRPHSRRPRLPSPLLGRTKHRRCYQSDLSPNSLSLPLVVCLSLRNVKHFSRCRVLHPCPRRSTTVGFQGQAERTGGAVIQRVLQQ